MSVDVTSELREIAVELHRELTRLDPHSNVAGWASGKLRRLAVIDDLFVTARLRPLHDRAISLAIEHYKGRAQPLNRELVETAKAIESYLEVP